MRAFMTSRQRKLAALLTIFVCSLSQSANGCIDDDATMAQLASDNNIEDISACVDVLAGCNGQNAVGRTIREICCATCADADLETPPINSKLPPTDETIQVFLLSGQSECGGSARVTDLDADPEYSELHGIIEDVWIGEYQKPDADDRFFIAPMDAGQARQHFGPEISFGERFHAVTGKRTMVVKYCVGGTNVSDHWNPATAENSWDKEADDGTAQWMVDNAGLDFTSKDHLFKNMVFTIRKASETLTNAGVPFEWTGIVWVQGQADRNTKDPLWKLFGENTARVWDGFRDALGGDVPIIDTGSANKNTLKSGKEYATQIVKGCKAKNLEWSHGANDGTSGCVTTTSNPCLDSNATFFNPAFYDFYGYDPGIPEDLKPDGATSKTFHWWVSFGGENINLHSAYEGMILLGRTLANNFIVEFTEYDLPSKYADTDPAIQFPLPRCADGSSPSIDNFCWIDHRDETNMVDFCTLVEDDNESAVEDDDESAASAMSFLMTISMLLILFGMSQF